MRGHFRASFATCADLEEVIIGRLPEVLQPLKLPLMDLNEVTNRAEQCYEVQYETTARLDRGNELLVVKELE
jgi:hypothetical protein